MPVSKPSQPVLNLGHPLARKMVMCWMFEEKGGDLRDLSPSRLTATENNGVPGSTGRYGRQRTYNGSNDYHEIDQGNQLLQLSGGFTFAALVNFDDPSGDQDIYGEGNTGSNTPFVIIQCQDQKNRLLIRDSGSGFWYLHTGSDNFWTAGDWHMITVVVPATAGDALIYRDGVLFETATESGNYGDATDLDTGVIAALRRTSVSGHADCSITFLAGWHRPLSAVEVRQLYADPWGLFVPKRTVVGFVAAGAGSQTISPTSAANTHTVSQPTVAAGAIAVAPSSHLNEHAINQAVLGLSIGVAPGSVSNRHLFPTAGDWDITLGAVALAPGSVANQHVISLVTLVLAGQVGPRSVANPHLVGQVVLTVPQQTVSPFSLANDKQVSLVTLAPRITVSPPPLVHTKTVSSVVIGLGALALAPSSLSNLKLAGQPTLAPGSVVVLPLDVLNEHLIGTAGIDEAIKTIAPLSAQNGTTKVNGVLTKDFLARVYHGTDAAKVQYVIPFPWLKDEDIRVTLADQVLVAGSDYDLVVGQLDLAVQPSVDRELLIQRITPHDLSDFVPTDGSIIQRATLDRMVRQALYYAEELEDATCFLIPDEPPGASLQELLPLAVRNGSRIVSLLVLRQKQIVTPTSVENL